MSSSDEGSAGDPSLAADAVIELDSCIRGWIYWLVASTFAWGFLVMISLKMLHWYQGSLLAYAYPLACVGASVLTLVSRGKARLFFAVVNFTSAVAWSAFYAWVVIQFTRHFWR